jgi:phage terminase small subunit
MVKLSPQQENFAQCIAKGMGYTEAYRASYNVTTRRDQTVWTNASQLASDKKVSRRIEELKADAAERTAVTFESITEMLLKAAEGCEDAGDHKGLADAAMKLAKLHGHIIEKRENTNRNLTPDELPDDELQRIARAGQSAARGADIAEQKARTPKSDRVH